MPNYRVVRHSFTAGTAPSQGEPIRHGVARKIMIDGFSNGSVERLNREDFSQINCPATDKDYLEYRYVLETQGRTRDDWEFVKELEPDPDPEPAVATA